MASKYADEWEQVKKSAAQAQKQATIDSAGQDVKTAQARLAVSGALNPNLQGMVNQQNEYEKQRIRNRPKEALVKQGKQIMWDASLEASRVANPTQFTRREMMARDAQLMDISGQAGKDYASAFRADAAGGRGQLALGNAIMASAMGQGDSVAGLQGVAAGDRLVRQAAAGASGSLLAQRAAASGLGGAGVDLATQVAQARASEQARRQSELAQNIRAMQSANLGAMGMASDRQLDMQRQMDADAFGNAALEQRANMANFESDEQMRQRAARALLVQMGREEARAAQARANSQANQQAMIAGGTAAANAVARIGAEWNKREKGEKK